MRSVKRNRSRRSAFTLLEVLLVVGIIALLAAFVVPQLMNVASGANEDVTKTMVLQGGTLAGMIELYQMNVGQLPEELKALIEKPEDEDQAGRWRGPYIKSADNLKDAWGRELQYKYPGEFNEGSYDLWSLGADGEDGTDDDIGNWTKED